MTLNRVPLPTALTVHRNFFATPSPPLARAMARALKMMETTPHVVPTGALVETCDTLKDKIWVENLRTLRHRPLRV